MLIAAAVPRAGGKIRPCEKKASAGRIARIVLQQVPSPSCPVVVRLRNWVGDVVLGIPALRLLEEHGFVPHAVGKGWARSLLAGQGWNVVARPARLQARVAQLRSLRRHCAAEDAGFERRDNALVLPTSFSAALEMRLAGLRAVGYGQEARGFLLARTEPITYGGHALVSYWQLACRFLGIDRQPPASVGLKVGAAEAQRAERRLAEAGVGAGFVVICPFAGGTFEHLDKTWPRFPAYTAALLGLGRPVVACPGPGEADIVRTQHAGVTMLDGLDLGTYAAVLQRAALVVSNDTGPAHMAAAVDTPVLSVLGPTKPEQWAPWGPRVTIVQGWPEWPSVGLILERTRGLLAG